MKHWRWEVKLGLALVLLSANLYLVHFLIFSDAHHILIYLVGDVAFVPMEVLLITLILHRVLAYRERQSMLKKLNMVIGAFFSEVGTELLERLAELTAEPGRVAVSLDVTADWTAADFARAARAVQGDLSGIVPRPEALVELRKFLAQRREFLLRLLENPNLLEHESFTDLLWAVFHLTEELCHRADIMHSPESDLGHLAGDVRRVHERLLGQWLAYMQHLAEDYPYLFSLAVRTNPFNPKAVAEVTA